jgi:hypothetical protein
MFAPADRAFIEILTILFMGMFSCDCSALLLEACNLFLGCPASRSPSLVTGLPGLLHEFLSDGMVCRRSGSRID